MPTMPSDDDIRAFISTLFDRASSDYDAVGTEFFGPLAERLVDAMGLTPGEHVLDLGSGRGAALHRIAERVGAAGSVRGVDVSPAMVAATSADLAAAGTTQATIEVGDAGRPPSRPGGYDAIVAALLVFFSNGPLARVAAARRTFGHHDLRRR
jgi:ubiquinone/menaquinone biosynthesis C-methylase UbiE